MAKGNDNFGFTGPLGNISAYKRQGSNKVILRTKGGASKNKIRRSPKFAKLRLCQDEFSACSNLGAFIRRSFYPVKHLADSYISSHINSLLLSLLKLDKKNKIGERIVLLSQYRHLLDGFNLNRENPFNSVIRHPVSCILSRDKGSAQISIPQLLPGINFYNPSKYPLYRFTIVLGIIPDMVFENKHYLPAAAKGYFPEHYCTEWKEANTPAAIQNIELQLKYFAALADNYTMLLSLGIEFGYTISNAVASPVKYAGTACILATG